MPTESCRGAGFSSYDTDTPNIEVLITLKLRGLSFLKQCISSVLWILKQNSTVAYMYIYNRVFSVQTFA